MTLMDLAVAVCPVWRASLLSLRAGLPPPPDREREICIDDQVVRMHFITEMMQWNGPAPLPPHLRFGERAFCPCGPVAALPPIVEFLTSSSHGSRVFVSFPSD